MPGWERDYGDGGIRGDEPIHGFYETAPVNDYTGYTWSAGEGGEGYWIPPTPMPAFSTEFTEDWKDPNGRELSFDWVDAVPFYHRDDDGGLQFDVTPGERHTPWRDPDGNLDLIPSVPGTQIFAGLGGIVLLGIGVYLLTPQLVRGVKR